MHYPFSVFQLPDLLRELLTIGIKLIIAICLIQVLVMIVHKILLEQKERRMALLKSRYLSAMYLILATKRPVLDPPENTEQFTALTDVCIYLMVNASHEELYLIRETVRRCGIAGFYSAQLPRARFWIARYKLTEKLGFLKLPELAPLFRTIIESDHEDRQVVGKATWALSLISTEEDLPEILARVSQPDFMSAKFNEHLFVNIIASFIANGEKERLLALFGEILAGGLVPLLVKRDFVEACGNAGLEEARPLIISCWENFGGSPEMRIASLRSLQKLGGDLLDGVVLEGLRDADWRVRAVAAKSVERCSDAVVIPLEQALGDQNYHVRLNAALSLASKGEQGRAALDRQSQSSDRFVREVSRYVMRERELPC